MTWLKRTPLWACCFLAAVSLTTANPFFHLRGTRHGYGRNIRPLPCVSKGGEAGVCMFAWDCMKANGTHLGTCIDRFYFGSCCKMGNTLPPPSINEILPGGDSDKPKPPLGAMGIDSQETPDEGEGESSETPVSIGGSPDVVGSTDGDQATGGDGQEDSNETSSTSGTTETGSTGVTGDGSATDSTDGEEESSGGDGEAPSIDTEVSGETGGAGPVDGTEQPSSGEDSTSGTDPVIGTGDMTSPDGDEGAVVTEEGAIEDMMTESPDVLVVTEVDVTVDSKPAESTPDGSPMESEGEPDIEITTEALDEPSLTTTEAPATSPDLQTATPVSAPATESTATSAATITIETEEPGTTITLDATTDGAETATVTISVTEDDETTVTPSLAAATPESVVIPITTAPEPVPSDAPEDMTTTSEAPATQPFFPVFPVAGSSEPDMATTLSPFPEPDLTTEDPEAGLITIVFPSVPSVSTKPPAVLPTVVPEQTTLATEEPTSSEETSSEVGDTSVPITDAPTTAAPATAAPTTAAPTTAAPITAAPTTAAPTEKPELTEATKPETEAPATTLTPATEAPTTLAPNVTAVDELLEKLNGSSARDICGKPVYPSRRIVGGSAADFGEWPWQVSLRQWRQVTFLHKCGAALLNENWAITAAHCVEGVQPEQLLLRLGEYNLESSDEPYDFTERKVQIIATHPQFDARTFEYDLALLRFYEPVNFQPNIIPICVPQDDYNFIGDVGFVTGWGRLYEDGPLPSILQKVPVPVITNEECEAMYKVAGYVEHIPNIFICAGYEAGSRDSCEGDSGGPLVIMRDGVWQLAGVISWGIGCALPNQPGVYTRISEFREWIEKIIVF